MRKQSSKPSKPRHVKAVTIHQPATVATPVVSGGVTYVTEYCQHCQPGEECSQCYSTGIAGDETQVIAPAVPRLQWTARTRSMPVGDTGDLRPGFVWDEATRDWIPDPTEVLSRNRTREQRRLETLLAKRVASAMAEQTTGVTSEGETVTIAEWSRRKRLAAL